MRVSPATMRRVLFGTAAIAALLAIATLLIALLERSLGVANADAVFLLAVVAAAVAFGTPAAIGTAVASFVLYDFFFVQPVLTLNVADRTAWLNLVLLLFVGVIVGQLAAMQRNRADAAVRREREAQALYVMSRELATHGDTEEAIPPILDAMASASGMRSLWIGLGGSPEQERVVARVGPDAAVVPRLHCMLRPASGQPPEWVSLHAVFRSSRDVPAGGGTAYRAAVEADGAPCGSIWGIREPDAGAPDRGQTRVLSIAADQLGRAIERRRLAERAATVEVARRSEELKTALLDSVSHDLRTPLASIRAAAGTLMDPDVRWSPEEEREAAATIDGEAERLDELVTNLLDMSRVESGQLVVRCEPFALDDLVRQAVDRRAARLRPRLVRIDLDPGAPPVLVDGLLFEQVVGNVLDNAARHTPAAATVRIHDEAAPEGMARLVIEDDGPGVPPDALPHLFDKFFRVRTRADATRGSTGVGLSVAQGLVQAMGGRIAARASERGGLAIVIDVPADRSPALHVDGTAQESPRPTPAEAPAATGGEGAR